MWEYVQVTWTLEGLTADFGRQQGQGYAAHWQQHFPKTFKARESFDRYLVFGKGIDHMVVLGGLGKEGWEAVSATEHGSGLNWSQTFLMKRALD